MMKIGLTSVYVEDQQQALEFYTRILGFSVIQDFPVGEFRWLTVGSAADDMELLLEPNVHPAAATYQRAIYADGIPAISLLVDDMAAEFQRLIAAGVRFEQPPTATGTSSVAVFDDTCGNLIQIAQPD